MKTGIYVHIPFCVRKCLYCDFPSYAGAEDCYAAYKNALCHEIRSARDSMDREITSVFIGGGTPTALPPHFLSHILEEIRQYRLEEQAEITVEANPGTLNRDVLKVLKDGGVNRLSIGLQAWQNRLLRTLGRIHTVETFLENYYDAMAAGFSNINIDLMFALPGQEMEDWRETLSRTVALNPSHISAYSLIIEEGTYFDHMFQRNELSLPDEDMDREMYHYAIDFLADKKYLQYEISNFSKEGFSSRHNCIYWERDDYVGFGLGAHSLLQRQRYHNTYDLPKYIHAGGDHAVIKEDIQTIGDREAMQETMFLGLRMCKGVSVKDFYDRYHVDIFQVYGNTIDRLVRQELLYVESGAISLTQRGIDVSNLVFAEFF